MSLVQRLQIVRGELYGGYEPYDMPGAYIVLKYQVYDLNGHPATGLNWDRAGSVVAHDTRKDRNTVILGDVYKTATLHEYTVNREPTPESDAYDQGYRKGWKAKRAPSMKAPWETRDANAAAFLGGVIDGWRDRKRPQ